MSGVIQLWECQVLMPGATCDCYTWKYKSRNEKQKDGRCKTDTDTHMRRWGGRQIITTMTRNMQKRWMWVGSPVIRHRATYLFGSFRSGGVSVSTSVESVKIKPNCGGRRRGGGGGRGGEEEGIWLKALPDSHKQFFFLSFSLYLFLLHHHRHAVRFATSALVNGGELAVMMMMMVMMVVVVVMMMEPGGGKSVI